MMNEHEKSDGLIVPKKPPNKVGCDRLRRWWREGGWPREGRSSMTRTGLSAGLCVPNMLSAHVSATFAAPTYDPRWEPDAVIPHVRICGGGGGQPPSLLLPNEYGPALTARARRLHGSVGYPCYAERPVQHCAPVALETSPALGALGHYTDRDVSRRSPTWTRLLRVRLSMQRYRPRVRVALTLPTGPDQATRHGSRALLRVACSSCPSRKEATCPVDAQCSCLDCLRWRRSF